jgi:hypothetical protein
MYRYSTKKSVSERERCVIECYTHHREREREVGLIHCDIIERERERVRERVREREWVSGEESEDEIRSISKLISVGRDTFDIEIDIIRE